MTGTQQATAYVLLLIALVAGSTPRRVGDGGEYVAMALNVLDVGRPWLTSEDIARRASDLHSIDDVAARALPASFVPGRGSRGSFVHFWLYPVLASPFVWASRVVGTTPLNGFTWLNLALLGLAFVVVRARLSWATTLLVMAGPIVWWVDKAHTEVFTLALLAIAMVTVRDAAWWAFVAIGAAATQNPPQAVLLPLTAMAALGLDCRLARDRRFWMGLAAGVALASLHPLFYTALHGTPSLLIGTTRREWPELREVGAVLLDPAIGLLGRAAPFAVCLVAALLTLTFRSPRRLLAPDIVAAAIGVVVFLFTFARAGHLHHGATPGMSRYALWLIPLALPLMREAEAAARWWPRALMPLALVSCVWMSYDFHPKHDENSREPGWLATWLWTKHPDLDDPLPEVFVESLSGLEADAVPVATRGCEKVLIVGTGNRTGAWPIPCYPQPVDRRCREPGTLCYANRVATRYAFRPAPGRQRREMLRYSEAGTWPIQAEPTIRKVMDDVGWPQLRRSDEVGNASMLRAAFGTKRVATFEGAHRLLIVITETGPDARLTLRVPQGAQGPMVNGRTGEVIEWLRFDGASFEAWHLPLPPNQSLLVVALAPRR